jgi:hypothetical protein
MGCIKSLSDQLNLWKLKDQIYLFKMVSSLNYSIYNFISSKSFQLILVVDPIFLLID